MPVAPPASTPSTDPPISNPTHPTNTYTKNDTANLTDTTPTTNASSSTAHANVRGDHDDAEYPMAMPVRALMDSSDSDKYAATSTNTSSQRFPNAAAATDTGTIIGSSSTSSGAGGGAVGAYDRRIDEQDVKELEDEDSEDDAEIEQRVEFNDVMIGVPLR